MDKKELFGVLDAFNMLNKLNVPDAESVVEQEEEPVNLDKEAFKQFFEETLRRLIIDEHEAINGYESFKLSLLAEKENESIVCEELKAKIEAALRVIEDIVKEENKHVGQLEELLSEKAKKSQEKGEEEGKDQVDGKEDADEGKEPEEKPEEDKEKEEDADPFESFGK